MTKAPHLTAREHGVFVRLAEGQTIASTARSMALNQAQVAYTAVRLRRIFGVDDNREFGRIYNTPNAWRFQ
jgi:DNA-binding CsgD family transcriptional regulator